MFGGVTDRGIYDNMKTAVDKIGRGKELVVNKRFHAMVSHYLFEVDFFNPASGWEKVKSFKQLQKVLLSKIGGDHPMVDVLTLVVHHEPEQVEQAITEALQSGCTSKDHVINCLHRLIEAPPPEPVLVAAHLPLSIEH